jgi:hypothetical protein
MRYNRLKALLISASGLAVKYVVLVFVFPGGFG